MTVSPVFFDLTGDPGTTITTKVRIRNNTNSPIPIKLGVEKIVGDQNGNITLKDNNDQTLSWITFPESSLVAKPLEWTDVPFSIDIPKDAAYGYYWTITFKQDESNPLTKNGVNLTGAAAVPILLNVKKAGATTQGKLTSFTTNASFYEYLPVKFSTRFQNTGNVHIRPKGNIFIKDWLGNQVGILNVNDADGAILPDATRAFEADWSDSFISVETKMQDGQPKLDKNGKPEQTLNIQWSKILDLRIGRYTASEILVLSTPTKDIPYQAETSFFVFPWKIIIGLIVFVIFAGLGFYSTIKNLFTKVFKLFKRTKTDKI
jgi:hypothetical protein